MSLSFFLGCDRLGGLCTFRWPIFSLLPCGIIRSGTPCRAVRGRPTRRVKFKPICLRAPVSVSLSCDHPGSLCTFGRPICYFLPCAIIVRSGASCRAVRGHLTRCIRFELFHSWAPVSVLLSCDHLGALCTFGWPLCRFLPCGIVWSSAPCEVARPGAFGSGCFIRGCPYQFF